MTLEHGSGSANTAPEAGDPDVQEVIEWEEASVTLGLVPDDDEGKNDGPPEPDAREVDGGPTGPALEVSATPGDVVEGGGMAGIGERIRALRMARSMSLDDLSRGTKISVSQLKLLEAGDEAALPDPVFVKGFIRCCARVLDFDPDSLIAMLDMSSPSTQVMPAAGTRTRGGGTGAGAWTASLPAVPRGKVAMYVALGVVILIVVVIALSATSDPSWAPQS